MAKSKDKIARAMIAKSNTEVNTLKADNANYKEYNKVTETHSQSWSTVSSHTLTLSPNKSTINKPISKTGKIKKIYVDVSGAGSITFTIFTTGGYVNYAPATIKSTNNFAVVDGTNTINCDIDVTIGQYIAITTNTCQLKYANDTSGYSPTWSLQYTTYYYMYSGATTARSFAFSYDIEVVPPLKDYIATKIYTMRKEKSIERQWEGLECATLGTSLTKGGGWDAIVKEALGLSKMYNRGVSGSTLTDFSSFYTSDYVEVIYKYDNIAQYDETNASVFATEAGTGITAINSWYSSQNRIDLLPTTAHLILIDCATNDAFRAIQESSQTTPKINWTDFMTQQEFNEMWETQTLVTSRLEGAFYAMIQRVQTRCPNARIVVWGMPINNLFTTLRGDYLAKFMQMYERIIQLCRKCGVVFMDTMMYEGANRFNVKTEYHTADYVHFTSDLAKRSIANAMIGTLRHVYPKNYF